MVNHQDTSVTDVTKAGLIDRLLVRLKSGQSLEEALTVEQCRQWFYTKLSDASRAPVIALQKELEYKAEQAANLENSAMVWVSLTPDQKSRFQSLCETQRTSVSQRISTLILDDLRGHMDKQPTPQ